MHSFFVSWTTPISCGFMEYLSATTKCTLYCVSFFKHTCAESCVGNSFIARIVRVIDVSHTPDRFMVTELCACSLDDCLDVRVLVSYNRAVPCTDVMCFFVPLHVLFVCLYVCLFIVCFIALLFVESCLYCFVLF